MMEIAKADESRQIQDAQLFGMMFGTPPRLLKSRKMQCRAAIGRKVYAVGLMCKYVMRKIL